MHVLFSVLLVLMGALLGQACRCYQKHTQKHFCDSDFVIQASMLRAEETQDGQLQYAARIFKVFKSPENSTALTKRTKSAILHSPLEGSLCGVHLEIRVKYAISGTIRDGKLYTDMCSLQLQWNELKTLQKRGFHRKYDNHCDCEVQWCSGSRCGPADDDTCIWNTWPTYSICFEKHGICRRTNNGTCGWAKSRDLRNCVRAVMDEEKMMP